jgi:hypothetical protein
MTSMTRPLSAVTTPPQLSPQPLPPLHSRQAMSKGVSWYQPFVQLLPAGTTSSGGAAAVAAAAVAAAGGGRDPAKPLGCFTVQVQPQLPLIKVHL